MASSQNEDKLRMNERTCSTSPEWLNYNEFFQLQINLILLYQAMIIEKLVRGIQVEGTRYDTKEGEASDPQASGAAGARKDGVGRGQKRGAIDPQASGAAGARKDGVGRGQKRGAIDPQAKGAAGARKDGVGWGQKRGAIDPQAKGAAGARKDGVGRGQKRKRQREGEIEGDEQPRPYRFRQDSPYPCLFCPGRFTLRHNLVRHATRFHAADWNNQMYPSDRMIKKHGFHQAWELHSANYLQLG